MKERLNKVAPSTFATFDKQDSWVTFSNTIFKIHQPDSSSFGIHATLLNLSFEIFVHELDRTYRSVFKDVAQE